MVAVTLVSTGKKVTYSNVYLQAKVLLPQCIVLLYLYVEGKVTIQFNKIHTLIYKSSHFVVHWVWYVPANFKDVPKKQLQILLVL